MSSPTVDVQALIKASAPDFDYQGCCLHSLNLVICKASQITAVRNMTDNCQQAYLYFQNSYKRQRFLELIIKHFGPSEKKQLKLVDYARPDGLSGITHLALFLSCTLILSRHGMKYATPLLMMRTYILKR